MKKRLLACLLVLSLFATGLGFAPAAQAAEDGIAAQWTTKENLAPADREIVLQPDEGTLSEDDGSRISDESVLYQDSDVVTVIVELEEQPLLTRASGDVEVFAASAQGRALEQDLRAAQERIKGKIRAISGAVSTQSVNGASDLEYSYTTVLNGFSMKLPYGDIAEARQIDGVKRIFVAEQYSLPTTYGEDEYTISMSSSAGMVGADEANTLGYDGTGTIVAVLDTGFDEDHEAFSVMPENGKYSKADIAGMLQSKLSCGVSNVDEVYINEKAPFGYDYANGDTDAEAVGQSHGVHVAGTVAGNNGDDFRGVAPNAQLMIMKIFADNSGSTGDDIILAGLDDAVKLGADAVNLSLGSPAGFTEYGDEDEEETDGYLTYSGVYTRAEEAGINVMIAAGNETSSTYYNPSGTQLTLAQYPDSAIVASPSTLKAAVSVASVDNVGYFKNHIQLADGSRYAYDDAADYNTQTSYNILSTMEGQTLEYVAVPGLGEEADFEGLDLTGKVALIQRGTINFDVKAANAAAVGAVAAIIYNNTNEGPFVAALTEETIPVIGVSKEAGEAMLAAGTQTVSFSADYYGKAENPTGWQISSFSSIGPAPNLTIKPEISAPGGLIYSSVIGGGYESMSGTSMATPHMAGEAAVLRQYLRETDPGLSNRELGELANSLLMSTAVPSLDNGSGTYFSVRRQGAGVANVYNAIVSGAYLSVEGSDRPKAEVGSSRDGAYTYTATVHNLTDSAKTYSLDTAALVETITELDGVCYVANSEKRLSADEVDVTYTGLTGGKLTVAANGTATFTVTIALTASGKAYLDENFPNGSYVEGFTFLTAEDAGGVSLSVPFLGFYGDWGSLDVFDGDPGETQNMLGTALADIDNSGYGYFLGVDTETGAYDESRLAFAPRRANRQLVARVSLLRNVDHLEEVITDEAGNVVYDTGDLGMLRKTYGAATMTGIQYTAILYTPGWNGRLMKDGENNVGDWAPDGQWYTYTLRATPNGGEEEQTKSFRFYLDNTQPAIDDVQLYEEDGKVMLTCLASDNFYLKRLRVIDSTQEYYYLIAQEEFAAVSETGQTVRITFDVTDLAATLSAEGKNPGRVGLLLEDAALNENLIFVDIGPQSMTLDSLSLAVGESKQAAISIKPQRMADTKLTWSSQDPSIATVDDSGMVTGVADGETMITATAVSGLTAYARVIVGKGTPVLLTYGEAPELNDRFQTQDGFFWKVIGYDEVQLIEDQNKASDYGANYADLTGDVVIPSTVEYGGKTFRVTSIGYQAFRSNQGITSVTIPEGVTDVGYSAFFMCMKLAKVSLPDSLEYVDTYAFNTFIATEFDRVPANLKWIGESAFQQAKIDTLDLPEGLTHIGNKAFYLSAVKSLSLPESVTEYGDYIFYGCENLSYVELPGNMKETPEGIFWNCTSLKRISLPQGLTKIGNASFYGSGLERITLPDTVTEIDDWAFAWLTNMKTIDIPDSVETIGFSAYIYAAGVETIRLGAGVTSVGKDAFHTWNVDLGEAPVMQVQTEAAATALRRSGYGQEILLDGVPYTGYNGVSFTDGTFSYMPISDTEVQVVGFNDQTGETEITMPAEVYCEGDDRTYTVTSVNDKVFFQNQSIYKLHLPDTLTDLGERAFDQMFNVCEVNIPQNLENVGYQAMGYLGWDGKSIGLEFNKDLVLEVPGTIEFMDECAFAGNQHGAIVVGEGLTEIGDYAFTGCYNATSLTLPSTLERIGLNAFQDCTSLTSVELPDSVTYIDDNAFATLDLKTIDLPENLEYIGSSAFSAYVYNEDYTAQYWVGPRYVELNGKLSRLGYNAFRPDADIVAVLNSQRNLVVEYSNLEKLPTVCWDGKTDIPFNDGSVIPAGTTVTVTGDVTIDGKLTIEGSLVVAPNANLTITEDAWIVGSEKITYETCDGGADCCSRTFQDLDVNRWYHEYTDYVIARGLMNGVSDSRFAPNSTLTRGMLVTTLYRLAGEPEVTEPATFTDVPENRYFTKAIAWAQDVGLAKGVTDTRFAPESSVTREQAVTFLYRYVTLILEQETMDGGDLNVFQDSDRISQFAREAMAWATAEGFLEGYGDGKVGPKNPVTRAQMAKFLTILSKNF